MLFMTEKDAADDVLSEPDTADEDAALVRSAAAGNTHAFEQLIGKYERLVFRSAFYAVGHEEDAADLTQEILLRVWHGLPSFRGNARFLTWLTRIIRNTCADHLRKKRRTVQTESLSAMPDEEEIPIPEPADPAPESDPHAVYEKQETAGRVRDALQAMPEEYRILILMRDVEGMTYETIAGALGCEIGTVKSRLHRARALLRSHLASCEGAD